MLWPVSFRHVNAYFLVVVVFKDLVFITVAVVVVGAAAVVGIHCVNLK